MTPPPAVAPTGAPLAGSALLPAHRPDPFSPPSGLTDDGPIRPLTMAGGAAGWLVTDFAMARRVLADLRFSSDFRRMDDPIREIPDHLRHRPQAPGSFLAQDPPDHTRYRRLLTGQFTVARMRALDGMIQSYVDARLDAMAARTPPIDLVAEFALPVPSMVICELLGVDYSLREEFQSLTADLVRVDVAAEEMIAARGRIERFMAELVAGKRATAPAELDRSAAAPTDLLHGLIVDDPTLTDEELSNIGFLLLAAGHETTANMLGIGTFALLTHPDQWAALRADEDLLPGAVEELMRWLTIIQFGTSRIATEDVDLDGTVVAAGQTVVVHLPTANRDPAVIEHPDTLDVTRQRVRHLGFGHGIHQCLGQQLARMEMITGWRALLRRFPQLRLAGPAEEIVLRDNSIIRGVRELPVTW